MIRPALAMVRFPLILVLALVCVACPRAFGDVGVVLNESLDTSMDRITGTGHSAVYFSRICPASPVKLRLCRPDEQGSVISNYINIGEDQAFEWNVAPLNIYLYGVEDPRDRPLFGSFKIKHVLEERYRAKYLSAYCQSSLCKTSYKAEWREMVGATMIRSMYIFVVDTTLEQDLELIAEFNALPNENHFNGVTRNCADFTRHIINTYFANATHPDYINDFGMTSPKAIARTFVHYAERHPEAHFRVLHFGQMPGTIKRSSEVRAGTEQLYHSKKLLAPMVIFANQALPVVVASYLITGRFNAEHVFEEHPTIRATELDHLIQVAKAEKDTVRVNSLETAKKEERAEAVGTPKEWKEYRTAFDAIAEQAVLEETLPDRRSLHGFFKHLDKAGSPYADANGRLWMEMSDGNATLQVGLSASNILGLGSDSRTAYELILARTESVLKSPKHGRETMSELKKDWALLQAARTNTVLLANINKRVPSVHDSIASHSSD